MGWGEPHKPSTDTDLVQRVQALEAVAHPPMPYVTCSECWCLVAEKSWDKHRRWHYPKETDDPH